MLTLFAQLIGIVAVCGAVVVAAPIAQRLTAQETMPQCQAGQWPEYNFGFAALHLDLGANMGEAVECEHATDAVGDTDQQTTTGMAHYDHVSNTPSFRQGGDNWALTAKGLVFWSGTDNAVPSGAIAMRSPGSSRLAAAAAQNSSPVVASGVLGGAQKKLPIAAPGAVASAWLSRSQIAGVASLLGIKDDKVQSMTVDDLSLYTQQSGASMADVTRTINTESP